MKRIIPPALLAGFDDTWKDFTQALTSLSLTLPDEDTVRESMKIVFSLSEFVCKSCGRVAANSKNLCDPTPLGSWEE